MNLNRNLKPALFILFQGSGTNVKSWNEYTESKFLDKLKAQIPSAKFYTYQDKIHNIWHYHKSNIEKNDFPSDLDFGLDYVDIPTHITTYLMKDLEKKYGVGFQNRYNVYCIAWSAGAYLALFMAHNFGLGFVKRVFLMDPALFTPRNMQKRLNSMRNDKDGYLYPLHNSDYKKLLRRVIELKNDSDIYKVNNTNNILRSTFIQNNIPLRFSVPVTSFVNFQEPERGEWSEDFNNLTRLDEIRTLQSYNGRDMYEPFVLKNKSHFVFNKKKPASQIVNVIKARIV